MSITFNLDEYNDFLSNADDYFFGQDEIYRYVSMTIQANTLLDKSLIKLKESLQGEVCSVRYFSRTFENCHLEDLGSPGPGLSSWSFNYGREKYN